MKLDTLLCQVSDMDRAVAFYRDVLGSAPTLVTPHWSQFDLNGVVLGLHPIFSSPAPAPAPSSPGGWVVGINTPDLRALRHGLLAAGVHVGKYHEVPGGIVLDFHDPDGNPLQAIQNDVAMSALAE